MAADASIYGQQVTPRFNSPFEHLSQMLQIRQQQESARGLAEQRQAIAEQRRAQTDAIDRDAERAARLTELFATNPKPTRGDIMKADPTDNGVKIATALDALQDVELKRYKDQRAVTKEAIAGVTALPESMRQTGYGAVRKTFIDRGWATPEQIPEAYSPEYVAGIQQSLLSPEKQYDIAHPKPTQVGDALVQPNAAGKMEEVYRAPAKLTYGAPEPMLVNGRRSVVRPGSDGKMYSLDLKPIAGESIAPDPRVAPKPTYEWAQTPQGTRMLTPEEIRSQGASKPLTAMEAMDERKYKKAEPVLRGIGELSEKINTGAGLLAKMGGGVAKIAAKANYDDDVAEYDALVSGFTPMVARALGHTGVLTQQDVDSVKALFPRPGDSKTLRDRKMKRVLDIISDLEGATTSPAKTLTPSAPPSKETPDQRIKRLLGGG